MTDDCSILDLYLTNAVNAYRAAFDNLAGPVNRPEIVISGWETTDAALPATYTHPDYAGASYLISRGTGNRSYIISNVVDTDGSSLQVLGAQETGTAVIRLRDTAYFHSITDAHNAARAAIED